jgi:hypothetical protein
VPSGIKGDGSCCLSSIPSYFEFLATPAIQRVVTPKVRGFEAIGVDREKRARLGLSGFMMKVSDYRVSGSKKTVARAL